MARPRDRPPGPIDLRGSYPLDVLDAETEGMIGWPD